MSVISDYGKAKDPDELIKIDPKLWQECVENRMPAVDWILKKYENKLNLMTGPGKKEYSDMAMKIFRTSRIQLRKNIMNNWSRENWM